MDLVWAPWRAKYIKMNAKDKNCIFCYFNDVEISKIDPSYENLLIYKSSRCFVMMNKYPYVNGHLMVIPYRHISDIIFLDNEEKMDIFNNIQFCVEVLKEVYKPDGFNIGINIGRIAGAGIDQHLHFHIVPRFSADHNFMTVISNTRVISFSLEETYNDLIKAVKTRKKRDSYGL